MPVSFFRKIVDGSRNFRITIGQDPQRVEAPALVLFPLLPATLCCGLAGILVLSRKTGPAAARGGDLSALFGEATTKNLAALLGGTIPSAAYLGGRTSQEAMAEELFRLKGEDAFGRIFFNSEEARRLTRLSEEMHAFLRSEECLLEEQAGRMATAELEAVNHGLVLIRDLIWGLDRDVLDNVQKIVRLAGVDTVADMPPDALPKYRKINSLLNGLDRLEVRGRDSAGITLSCVPAGPGAVGQLLAELRERGLEGELRRRMDAGDLIDGSITGSLRA
ncbi:MAG: hypothetical protein IH628_06410, partial [Proteobacteria bacterium]|nr:hypothetical protein [Pseudomonadota bacterium]